MPMIMCIIWGKGLCHAGFVLAIVLELDTPIILMDERKLVLKLMELHTWNYGHEEIT